MSSGDNINGSEMSVGVSRRAVVKGVAAGAAALAGGLDVGLRSVWAQNANRLRVGMTTAGLGAYMASAGGFGGGRGGGPRQAPGEDSPRNTINFMRHCHGMGCSGVQMGLSDWSDDFADKVRGVTAELDTYYEGTVGLPRDEAGMERFEEQVRLMKRAGAEVTRTVTLGPRSYETFDTTADYRAFQASAEERVKMAARVCERHGLKLAVENHKDWRADDLAALINRIGSEWVGATIDTGNNVSLLETVEETTRILAPMAMAVHFKDMDVREYEEGFLLSEVAFGSGIVDLAEVVRLIHEANPKTVFSMETIVRDPLRVPVLGDKYWASAAGVLGVALAKTLAKARERGSDASGLPSVSGKSREERFAYETGIINECLEYSWQRLGFERSVA